MDMTRDQFLSACSGEAEIMGLPDGVEVTAVARIKHADLYAAAKKLGSQAALARYLGVSQIELCEWINLRRVPPPGPVGIRWTVEYFEDMESRLYALTGKTWDQLFPISLRMSAEFTDCEKITERTDRRRSDAIIHYALACRERLADQSRVEDIDGGVRSVIERILSSCKKLDAKVIRIRYGLDGGGAKTLRECAEILGISHEYVRNLECRAMKVFRMPQHLEALETAFY